MFMGLRIQGSLATSCIWNPGGSMNVFDCSSAESGADVRTFSAKGSPAECARRAMPVKTANSGVCRWRTEKMPGYMQPDLTNCLPCGKEFVVRGCELKCRTPIFSDAGGGRT